MSEDRTKPPAGYAVREVGFGYMVVLACDTGPLVLRDGGAALMAARAHRDAVKRDGWVEADADWIRACQEHDSAEPATVWDVFAPNIALALRKRDERVTAEALRWVLSMFVPVVEHEDDWEIGEWQGKDVYRYVSNAERHVASIRARLAELEGCEDAIDRGDWKEGGE